jgi:hypothetical protein
MAWGSQGNVPACIRALHVSSLRALNGCMIQSSTLYMCVAQCCPGGVVLTTPFPPESHTTVPPSVILSRVAVLTILSLRHGALKGAVQAASPVPEARTSRHLLVPSQRRLPSASDSKRWLMPPLQSQIWTCCGKTCERKQWWGQTGDCDARISCSMHVGLERPMALMA